MNILSFLTAKFLYIIDLTTQEGSAMVSCDMRRSLRLLVTHTNYDKA